MGKTKPRAMRAVEEVDISAVRYESPSLQAPHLSGFSLRAFVWLMESPILGRLLTSILKSQNNITRMLQDTVIPERPMYRPEYPPQEAEHGVVVLGDDTDPVVADHIIAAVEEWSNRKPPMPMLIYFDADDLRKQAEASTKRFHQGNPISILDGIFIAIKDDIDCFPYPSKGATTFFDKIRSVEKDAVCVARLRKCGVLFIGKANMHELGLGVTGNNPNYGTARNPHSIDRYTGGSSSGPAALVSSGLCSAAIGTDGGGSVRIPSALCGIVGLKTTYGRTDMTGALCDCGTVEVASPLASSVEDAMLVYSAIAGSRPMDKLTLRPSPLCVPNLVSPDNNSILGSVKIGKYTEWFHDVSDPDISNTCEDALNLLCSNFGCQIEEIILPELEEMRTAHVVSIGTESFCDLNPHYRAGKRTEFTLDTRTSLALFGSFTSTDYVASQRIRRRIMYYHNEAFKKVDVIATPTTG
uniref:Amidase domain-containing protein n=1 Tax=Oryza brachyantha TaxID=4533 RepID=J3LV43_ORYBR